MAARVEITVEYEGFEFTVESDINYAQTFSGWSQKEVEDAIRETAERAIYRLKRIKP